MNTMEEKKREIAGIKAELIQMKILNPVNRVCRSTVDRTLAEANEINEKARLYLDKVQALIATFENVLTEAQIKKLEDDRQEFVSDIVAHVTAMEHRADEVKNSSVNSSAASANSESNEGPVNQNPNRASTIAKLRAVNKSKQVSADIAKLAEDLEKVAVDKWNDALDHEVEAGMKSIDRWSRARSLIASEMLLTFSTK